jgi:hypothetical protein
MFPGNNQDVNRGLGIDVPERDDLIVLVNDIAGDHARGDFTEQAFGHATPSLGSLSP